MELFLWSVTGCPIWGKEMFVLHLLSKNTQLGNRQDSSMSRELAVASQTVGSGGGGLTFDSSLSSSVASPSFVSEAGLDLLHSLSRGTPFWLLFWGSQAL